MAGADQAIMDSLLHSDVVLLTGAFDSNGSARMGSDGSRDSRAVLLDLILDGNDEIRGGDGDDLVFGQGGNDNLFGDKGADFVSGGAGNDSVDGGDGNDILVGDVAIVDTKNGDMANIAHGLTVVATDVSREAEAGIELGVSGTTVVPMIQVSPGREINAEMMLLPHLFGYQHPLPQANDLATTDGGLLRPYVSVVTDFANHLDQIRGNDVLSGGDGDDTLVGDDLVVVDRVIELNAANMANAEAVTRDLLDISDDFSDLVHEQFRLLGDLEDLDKRLKYDAVVIDQVFLVGADSLDGGQGNDVLVGDDNTMLTTTFVTPTDLAFSFRLFVEGVSDAGREIAHALLDLSYLEHRMRDEVTLRPHDDHFHEELERHLDHVLMGNDTILGGGGNDFIIGDALVTRSTTVRVTAGGLPVHDGKKDAWQDDDWKEKSEGEKALLKALEFHHRDDKLDPIRVGADHINGGTGDDLAFGDSFASTSSRLERGEGITDSDYEDVKGDAKKAIERLMMLTDTNSYWLAFQDPGRVDHKGNDHWPDDKPDVEFDNGDSMLGDDGDDILFGQDGEDVIEGDDGDDWLIGGKDKDELEGGTGDDTEKSGDEKSKSLLEEIASRQIDWEASFSGFGQSFSPFGADGAKLKNGKHLDDFLVLSEKSEDK